MLDFIPTGIDRNLDSNPRLARAFSIPIHQVQRIHTGRGAITVRQFPSAPKIDRTLTSGDDGAARQRAPVGDSLNDKQRGNDLPNPFIQRSQLWEVTNLSLCEEGQEDIHHCIV